MLRCWCNTMQCALAFHAIFKLACDCANRISASVYSIRRLNTSSVSLLGEWKMSLKLLFLVLVSTLTYYHVCFLLRLYKGLRLLSKQTKLSSKLNANFIFICGTLYVCLCTAASSKYLKALTRTNHWWKNMVGIEQNSFNLNKLQQIYNVSKPYNFSMNSEQN